MPYLLLTLAALFWGGNYVVGHILVQGADPILMTEARWALTAILLVLLYQRQIRDSRLLFRQNAPTLLILTLCGQVSFPLTLYWPAVDFGAERSDLHVCDPLHGAYY